MVLSYLSLLLGLMSTTECLDRIKMIGHFVARDASHKVQYLDPAQRSQQTFRLSNGLFVDHVGKPLTTPFAYLMVASPEGELISMARPHGTIFHHSSLSAGGDVSMAGYIKVENGRLKHITNTSGHYQPPLPAFAKLLKFWNRQGVDLRDVRVGFQVSISSSRPETFYYEIAAVDFLKLMSDEVQRPPQLLRAVLNSKLSVNDKARAVAHLLLLGEKPSAEEISLLRRQAHNEDAVVMEELESLASSLDFKRILDILSSVKNKSMTKVRNLFEDEMFEPSGSD